jgi:acetoin utilization protein AcuB
MTARDAMTSNPLTVTLRTSVAAALRLIRDNDISHLPAVDRGRILGVVRQERVLALTPSEATTLSRFELRDVLGRFTVEQAVEPALRLAADTPLPQAARAPLDGGAAEALVVEGDRLVGILTHSDLLRALLAPAPAASERAGCPV